MKYITHVNEKVIYAFDTDSNEYTITYPGFKTEVIDVEDSLWEELIKNPESYIYKDGQVLKANA